MKIINPILTYYEITVVVLIIFNFFLKINTLVPTALQKRFILFAESKFENFKFYSTI